MIFRQLFDRDTCTYTYLLADAATREAVLIDPVLELIDRDLTMLSELDLTLKYVLDTHVHADHITAAGELRRRTGARTVWGSAGGVACADVQADDGDIIAFGAQHLEVRFTPGHTDTCVTYVLNGDQIAFTGDALFIRGCGRTDFQQGDARTLYHSVHTRIFTLPDHTRVYPGHDYKGRTVSTVGEERRFNPRLGGDRTEDAFVAIMAGLQLGLPRRIHEAVPANLSCGERAAPAPGPS